MEMATFLRKSEKKDKLFLKNACRNQNKFLSLHQQNKKQVSQLNTFIIMAKFNYINWKNEFKANIPVLEQAINDAKATAKAKWMEYRKTDDDLDMYRDWRKAEKEVERLKKELSIAEIFAADKVYCNQYFYTDIKPWEVIGYVSEKCLLVRSMKAELREDAREKLHDSFQVGGFCGHFNNDLQEWDITSDEEGSIIKVRLHKDGCYYQAGSKGTRFHLSTEPVNFYDYNF